MASYSITFVDTEGNGIAGLGQSGEIPYNTSKLVFYNTSVEFHDNWNFLSSVTWNDIYQGKSVESIVYNGSEVSDGEEVDYSGGDIEIIVGYEYTPPGTVNPGGGSGGGSSDSGNSGESSTESPLPFSFTIKHCKTGTSTSIDGTQDIVVSTCYYLKREDEGTVGEYGLLNLIYYTGYEFTGKIYNYTNEQTYQVPSTITGYKLSSFFGIEDGGSITGSKDGPNDYTLYAYYDENNFVVNIDSNFPSVCKITESNSGKVYNLPYNEISHYGQYILLTAESTNAQYVFDYWDVNGSKYSSDKGISYQIIKDTYITAIFRLNNIPVDKIAINADVYEGSKYIYGLNDNQCPTKQMMLNNDYGIISINDNYNNTQCVKFSDISFHRTIKFTLKNNIGTDIDHSSTIYFASRNSSNVITRFASYYIEPNQITSGYNKSHEIVLDINKLGDYRNQNLVVGFDSEWVSARRLVFTINSKNYEIQASKEGSVLTNISTVQFLRSYYEGITINIYAN